VRSKKLAISALTALTACAGLLAACGGGGGPDTPPVPELTMAPTPDPASEGVITGAGTGSQVLFPGSQALAEAVADPTAAPAGTPTATPPPLTLTEEFTSVLVDTLSAEEFPRTAARTLEATFRNEPEKIPRLIGKSFVIQGNVREAGRDSSGEAFVTFQAGAGAVTCYFEKISEAELLRLFPDGRSVVTGRIDSWDSDKRILTVRGCRQVRGY
jgi:hypothetical protein